MGNEQTQQEMRQQYYYHGDHLGSAQLVTDWSGSIYEHLEYTPYGELWVDHATSEVGMNPTLFRFTGKELDVETGFYYYGARYLDPKTSRWISADPAMGEYIPIAPINDEAKKHNQNLPGMGGIFNLVNMHVYHYAGNNPVKLTDPDGAIVETVWDIVNAALGYLCAYMEFGNEDYLSGAISFLGAVADTIAAAVPGVPGGASIAIKVAQNGPVVYSAVNNIVEGVTDNKPGSLAIGVLQLFGIAAGSAGSHYLNKAEAFYNRISNLPRSMIYGAAAAGLKKEHIGIFFKTMSMFGVSANTIKESALLFSKISGEDFAHLSAVLNYQPPASTHSDPNRPTMVGPGANAVYSPDSLNR